MDTSTLKTLFIVGPTASGKTGLSIEIAASIGAEIICADSQTIRKYMDIGTAKPSIIEQSGIPHHLLDVINPYDDFNLSDYLFLARKTIRNIHEKGKKVIIVGGTGLYVDALYFQFQLPPINNNDYESLSIEELKVHIVQNSLKMPLNDKNKRHLINTLRRAGNEGKKGEPMQGSLIIGLMPPRDRLIEKINERVESMFQNGFIEEVQRIIDVFGKPPRDFDAIGYRIALRYIDGDISIQEAKELFKIADRQYARRQVAWFKRNPHITWFGSVEEAKSYILDLC